MSNKFMIERVCKKVYGRFVIITNVNYVIDI